MASRTLHSAAYVVDDLDEFAIGDGPDASDCGAVSTCLIAVGVEMVGLWRRVVANCGRLGRPDLGFALDELPPAGVSSSVVAAAKPAPVEFGSVGVLASPGS